MSDVAEHAVDAQMANLGTYFDWRCRVCHERITLESAKGESLRVWRHSLAMGRAEGRA